MKYTIRRAYEWLFPDDCCDENDQKNLIRLDVPRNSSDAIQLLTDFSWSELETASIEPASASCEIAGKWFALLSVWVGQNTGPLGYTAAEGDLLDHVTRKAPFYVYDPCVPLEDGCCAAFSGRCALYARFDVSGGCPPVEYRFNMRIQSKDGQEIKFSVLICVYSVKIPEKISLRISNWFNLKNIATRHSCELWSEEFWRMTEQYAVWMERARQNCFLLPFDAVNWNEEDGNWIFSFEHAKRLLEIFARHGMQTLECGPIIRQRFLGDDHFCLIGMEHCEAASHTGLRFIKKYYESLSAFLKKTGYDEICLFHVADEPFDASIREYEFLAQQIRRIIPTATFIDAVCTSRIGKYPDIPIPDTKRYEEDQEVFEAIQKEREVWYYTCALPGGQSCNRLLDIPLLKTRLLYWGGAKYGLSGYLHWGFNCYRPAQDPYQDLCPRFGATREIRYLPPGDTHLVYPGPTGPYGSVRLEQIRKGVEDWALLNQLRSVAPKRMREILDDAIKSFSGVCRTEDFSKVFFQLLMACSKMNAP